MTDPNFPDFWQSLYEDGQTHWDLGGPTPVFRKLAESGDFPPGNLIVLGAGRGHDARLFARHGFTVTAVDFAAQAIADMHALADPAANVSIIHADLFNMPSDFEGRFDYILDYTCFCAVEPGRRGEYADVARWLLKPDGTFISLVFPIGANPGGPPFAVNPDEVIDLFAKRGFSLQSREVPEESIKPRKGREELVLMQKKPT